MLARLLVIYLCCLVACVPFLWFCPETKGKSLEEIGVIFGDRHIHVTLRGSDIVEETEKSGARQAGPHTVHEETQIDG